MPRKGMRPSGSPHFNPAVSVLEVCRVVRGADAFKSMQDAGLTAEQAQAICQTAQTAATIEVETSTSQILGAIAALEAKLEAKMDLNKVELEAKMDLNKVELEAKMDKLEAKLEAKMLTMGAVVLAVIVGCIGTAPQSLVGVLISKLGSR